MLRTVDIGHAIKVRDTAALLEHPPVVIRVTKFDEEGNKLFSEEMSKAHMSGQEVIPVQVDSPGGQVYSLLGMLETMRSSKRPVATICTSKAMSCGAILNGIGPCAVKTTGSEVSERPHGGKSRRSLTSSIDAMPFWTCETPNSVIACLSSSSARPSN